VFGVAAIESCHNGGLGWKSFNSTIVFNSAGQVINLRGPLGGRGGRFGSDALNATRANSERILQIAAKFCF